MPTPGLAFRNSLICLFPFSPWSSPLLYRTESDEKQRRIFCGSHILTKEVTSKPVRPGWVFNQEAGHNLLPFGTVIASSRNAACFRLESTTQETVEHLGDFMTPDVITI
jgi:hypothetical protein